MLLAKNESKRLKNELYQLRTKNRELLKIILDIRDFVSDNFNKNVTITMIYRTQEEQQDIYGINTRKKSPHQFWQAVDLRSKTFTQSEIEKIVDYLNDTYDKKNYYSKFTTRSTAVCHKVPGQAYHFHIQFVKI